MAHPDPSDFPGRLRAVRLAYGQMTNRGPISQATFSQDLGLKPQRYAKYEQGLNWPPLEVLQSIRRVTGISLDYLVCGTRNGLDGSAMHEDPVITLGDRLAWARETQSPWLEVTAKVMGVTALQWQRWEEDLDGIPIEKANEFCQRFSVTLDFLLHGSLDGIDPQVLRELLRAHPELKNHKSGLQQVVAAPSIGTRKAKGASRKNLPAISRVRSGQRRRVPLVSD